MRPETVGITLLSAMFCVAGCSPAPNNSRPSSTAARNSPSAVVDPPPQILHATEDPKTILAKVVEAYGGDENLPRWDKGKLRYRAFFEKAEGGPPGGAEAIIVDVFDLPGRLKSTVQPPPGQPGSSFTYCLDGDGGWIVQNGEKKQLPPNPRRRNKDSQHRFGLLCDIRPMTRDTAQASVLGEEDVNGRKAVGLSITCPPQPAFKAYFDVASGFLLKTVKPTAVKGRAENEEATVYLSDYQPTGQTFMPMRLKGETPEIGKMDVTLLSVEFMKAVDDSEFADP